MRVSGLFMLIIMSMFLPGCQGTGGGTLKPFTTDGCSAFPEGTLNHKDLWHKCCTEHDLKYWAGGTFAERLQADLDLRACVSTVGEPAIADLMLAGVRVGGSPWWPTSYRWSYGWPYTRGYRTLTPQEQAQVKAQKQLQGIE